ncbi:hypothetical protein FB645_003081 [Coemansia sp. IMI 203386]|nr:hypothetical protein FB645_003081 [Coemansia sp. IMI 203386]
MKIFTPIQLAFSRPFLLAQTCREFTTAIRFVHNTPLDKPGSDRVYKENFKWTPEEDAKLLEIADKHPSNWRLITEKLGTDKNLHACYNRWHRHQRIGSKPWTKEEDERLAKAVDRGLNHDKQFGNKTEWKLVANEMGNNRSQYQCKYRWAILSNRCRENESYITWTAEEEERMDKAISVLEKLRDADTIIDKAKQNEPWLVTSDIMKQPRPNGLGPGLAARVKTRELVRRWENASKRLGVDLRAVDPETMLKSYDGDCKGVRLTGPDGYYDPNGVPMVVMAYKKTELVLYYLAHRRAARRNQTKNIRKFLKY